MNGIVYRFELRRADAILATGHLSPETALEVGDRIEIGRRHGIVRTIEPQLGEREMRVVVQVLRDRE